MIKLLVSPSELANIRGSSIHEIFDLIHNNKLDYVMTDRGIKIPIVYRWNDNERKINMYTYPLPDHKQANCYIAEDDKYLILFSADTKVAIFDKENLKVPMVTILSEINQKHFNWFGKYIQKRFNYTIRWSDLKNPLGLNMDSNFRDNLFKGNILSYYSFGGIQHYQNIDTGTLVKVLVNRFSPAFERQNDAPTLLSLMAFALRHMDNAVCFFDGYLVSPSREDYRVSVDAITCYTNDSETIKDLKFLARYADTKNFDYNNGRFFAWWD